MYLSHFLYETYNLLEYRVLFKTEYSEYLIAIQCKSVLCVYRSLTLCICDGVYRSLTLCICDGVYRSLTLCICDGVYRI